MNVESIAEFIEKIAPSTLAESWDNVGLLVGDRQADVARVMACLTITPASAREAIDQRADLIVTHHPLPFRPLKRLTSSTSEGGVLLALIAARIAIYSPHTAFDSAAEGINQRLAEGLDLQDVRVLVPAADGVLGSGRWGKLACAVPLAEVVARLKHFLNVSAVQITGALDRPVHVIAVACGSAGEFLTPARALGCDCLVTGEVRFHTALEALATDVSLVLPGHFASERFAVEALAAVLARQFPSVHVWASREDRDPLRWG